MRNVIANVKRLREKHRLSQAQLSARLTEAGRPIRATGLHRLETGKRRVDADDLVALAIALDVSPISLLMPFSASGRVELTDKVEVDALVAWDWMRATRPLVLPDEPEEAMIRATAFQGGAVPMGARGLDPRLTKLYSRLEPRPEQPPLDWDAHEERRRGEHPEAP